MSLDIPPYTYDIFICRISIYYFLYRVPSCIIYSTQPIYAIYSFPYLTHFSKSSTVQLSRALLPAIPPPLPTSSHALGHNWKQLLASHFRQTTGANPDKPPTKTHLILIHRSPVPVPIPVPVPVALVERRLERRIRKSLSIAHFNARHPAGLCLAFVSLCCVSPLHPLLPILFACCASPFTAALTIYVMLYMLSRQIGCDWLKSCAPGSSLSAGALWVDWPIAILTSLSAFENFLGKSAKGRKLSRRRRPP